jgi:hypothetical protein
VHLSDPVDFAERLEQHVQLLEGRERRLDLEVDDFRQFR